jgi:hypothetical protein
MLFKETSVYTEKHTNPIIKKAELLIINAASILHVVATRL